MVQHKNASVDPPLPSQYNQAQHSHVLQDKQGNRYIVIAPPEPKEEASTSTISSNSNNLQHATHMVQWTTNIVTYHLSSLAGTTLSLQLHNQQSTSQGHLIIDSGTNVSVLGCTWAMVDDTGQRCKMSGFANDLVKSDIPVCSGKTVVEVGKQKVLLGMHEASYLKHNTHGLLSTGQACEYGTWVNDTLCRHGGGQCIATQDEHGKSYNFDLDVSDGLLTLNTHYPTKDELESLPTVWLTSLHPWDPRSLEVTNKLVRPLTVRTSDNTIRATTKTKLEATKHTLKIGLTKGLKKPPDYNTFCEQLCLATSRNFQENLWCHNSTCW